MKQRCLNPNKHNYHRYGGRGIQVCKEWLRSAPFIEWALNNGYQDNLTIDRIDNDGNYEPSNCRWITNEENQKNRTIKYNQGANHARAKLTEEDVLAIRALPGSYRQLAKQFSVSRSQIRHIKKRWSWRHL